MQALAPDGCLHHTAPCQVAAAIQTRSRCAMAVPEARADVCSTAVQDVIQSPWHTPGRMSRHSTASSERLRACGLAGVWSLAAGQQACLSYVSGPRFDNGACASGSLRLGAV